MPIIPNGSLKHNKFEYLGIRKRKHDFLELTYLGLPKWLWEIPSERIRGKYIPFDELYRISYNSELTEEERNNALMDFMRNKYIRANAEENLSAREIIKKFKKLADKRYKKMKKLLAWGQYGGDDDDDDKKHTAVGDIHVNKSREIAHAHTEDPTGIM